MKEMTHVLGNARDDKTLRTRMGDIPDLSRWMEDNIPESLTIFRLPKKHWKRLRTSNLAERQMKEIKRRATTESGNILLQVNVLGLSVRSINKKEVLNIF